MIMIQICVKTYIYIYWQCIYIYIYIWTTYTRIHTYIYICIFSTLRTGFPICHFAVYHTTRMMCGVVRSLKMIANSLLQLAENYSMILYPQWSRKVMNIKKYQKNAHSSGSYTRWFCAEGIFVNCECRRILYYLMRRWRQLAWHCQTISKWTSKFTLVSTRCGREVSPLKHLESCFAETSEERAA